MWLKIIFILGGPYMCGVTGGILYRLMQKSTRTFVDGIFTPLLLLAFLLGVFMLGVGVLALKNKW